MSSEKVPEGRKKVPKDLAETLALFKYISPEVADGCQYMFEEWVAEFRIALKNWADGGPEPDWDEWRQSAEETMAEEMMY